MLYQSLASLVLLLHLAFIVFVVAGGLLALRWRWAPVVHLPAAAWGAAIEFFGGICPLTPLENALRRAGGDAPYAGDFLDRYLVSIVYPAGLTHGLQLALGGFVVAVNVLVYALVLRRARA
jgi:hypothetical protein